ncbi:unnamed protein product [Symbiodinium microadriaticum]|nr:unnamed protein product [Symbiodinium microadriaticum]
MREQSMMGGGDEPKFACKRGMHLQLDKSLSDHHVVNPYAEDTEEHHFVLPHGVDHLETHRGPCSELVYGPPLFDADIRKRYWDPEEITPLDYLDGFIEVRCIRKGSSASLQVIQYSCREYLPFSVMWANDPTLPGQLGPPGAQFEYAEFHCGDPFVQHGPDLLQNGVQELAMPRAHTLMAALGACEDEKRCAAVAVHPDGSAFRMLDKFACSLVPEATSTQFDVGDEVQLSLIVQSTPLDGKADVTDTSKTQIGVVLESWSLESPESHVLVQFQHGPVRILPEHLQHKRLSWTVVRKIRARQVACNDLQAETSCDVHSISDAEVLQRGSSLTAADCQQMCSSRMQNSTLLNGCCILTSELCALTRGEHFKGSTDSPDQLEESAASCRQLPCSLDPSCSFGAGDFGVHSDAKAEDEGAKTTVYFDFAHPLSMPFYFDVENLQIFHFTSQDKSARKARRAGRLVHPIGSTTVIPSNASRVNLGLEVNRMTDFQVAHHQLQLVCDAFGQKLGRKLTPPNLQEAAGSGECDEPHEAFESCLIRVGCGMLGDHQPFAPPWFAQLPFDILAWQAPAAFCCGRPYTIDQREDSWMKTLLDSAGIQAVSISKVEDSKAHQGMQASLETGSAALKKLLSRHIADEEMLNWLGQLVRTALHEFKKILTDLKETIDSEGPELEISSDGTSFFQVQEFGDQQTPSGRRGTEVARWCSERGAFLQIDPKSNSTGLQKTWNLVAAIPGAIFNYGLRPLWNFLARPLLKWGLSLMKWVLEHPRAALFISKFALAVRNRMCEKASWYVYGKPTESSVGAFTKMSSAFSEFRNYTAQMFTPATMLTMLQDVVGSSTFVNTVADIGKASYALILAWTGFASGGAAMALLSSFSALLAEASVEAGRRALELVVYQEIAKEIPSNLFDMLANKCLHKREKTRVTWTASKDEILATGTKAVEEVTKSFVEAGQGLANEVSRWTSFLKRSG